MLNSISLKQLETHKHLPIASELPPFFFYGVKMIPNARAIEKKKRKEKNKKEIIFDMRFLKASFRLILIYGQILWYIVILVYPVLNEANTLYTIFLYINVYYTHSNRSPFYFYCFGNSRARDIHTQTSTYREPDETLAIDVIRKNK